jgi:2'-5' RNA ligase
MQTPGVGNAPQNPPDTTRLFLALWPDDDVRAALQRGYDRWNWTKGAWVARPSSLHLTLHFLGNLPSSSLPELVRELEVPFDPFDLTLNTSQVWSNGIAVLQPEESPPGLINLQATLGEALQRLGISIEARPYRPHVTLARRAQGALAPADDEPVQWPVRSYALIESRAANLGGYRTLREYACRT